MKILKLDTLNGHVILIVTIANQNERPCRVEDLGKVSNQ